MFSGMLVDPQQPGFYDCWSVTNNNSGFAWIVFIYAGLAGLLVAFGTVSYHSIKSATSNPVDSLKDQ